MGKTSAMVASYMHTLVVGGETPAPYRTVRLMCNKRLDGELLMDVQPLDTGARGPGGPVSGSAIVEGGRVYWSGPETGVH